VTKYTWGDSVRVVSPHNELFPSDSGEVVGLWEVETEENAAFWGYPVGTVIYTVEFSDGSSAEVPDMHLLSDSENS